MQLSKIKIAGFKSFVDPTTLILPSKLVAIVGPNGCGKSNIIDAVTWVMGESSPKYLRGEALTDVIFNGSSARKPVGQASVELVFDNSDGKIVGEYGKFADVSIKRILNRDSDSVYYLNGVRCRKRDVVDIFFGTGLGPRSYSIIGQNMISRIIEAKPEELRSYIEEAAGISKYKDRRHETELRIQHTQENLARVNDLAFELEKQLNHLKQQANAAEKFKTLKQQERLLKAELYALQWRNLDSQLVDYTLQIQCNQTALEAHHAELSDVEKEIEHLRHEQRVVQDVYQEVQRRYYSIGNEITRIEQDILHHQERQVQWEGDLKQTENDWQIIKNQLEETEDSLHEFNQDIFRLEPQHKKACQETELLQKQVDDAEQTLQAVQNRWDEFTQQNAKTNQITQVEYTRIQHLEQTIKMLQKRFKQLEQDEVQIDFTELNKELDNYLVQTHEVNDEIALQQQQLINLRQELSDLQARYVKENSELDQVRSKLQQLRGQQASLQALQQTALGQRDNPAAPWMSKHHLDKVERLAQNLVVEDGWERAVEIVLGFNLQALCINDFNEVVPYLEDFNSGNLCVFTSKKISAPRAIEKSQLLLCKIKSPWPLDSMLTGVYVADSLAEALTLSSSLAINESVITRDGIWLNPSWLKIFRETDPGASVLQREQALKQLAAAIGKLEESQVELEMRISSQREKIQLLEKERDQLQQNYNMQQSRSVQISAQHKIKQARFAELEKQFKNIKKEQVECSEQLKITQHKLEMHHQEWQRASLELKEQDKLREHLIKDRESARQIVQESRSLVVDKKQEVHEVEIQLQTALSQKSSLNQSISRLQTQLCSANERKMNLQSELSSMPSLETLKKSLSRSLDKHVSIETELNSSRIAVESLDQEFKNLEGQKHIIEQDINKIRNILESLRVESQGWKVKADTLKAQIEETQFNLEDVLKDLHNEISVDEWQAKLDQIVQRINRLGPINLIAIEEYATCLERKQYLDKQLDDLKEGLEILEEAIAKIDKETKTRFQETFDKVNKRFQELFPTVFGGGKAYLELTSDDLLSAGITMMACPPGKRNTSIYLLSGGEKSLTAIAFIFSIFYLNPAPFCLLDEVDAALDDANILRFIRLVKSMADKTQFIFISHNKITIEMAQHLIGVTMNEPGVSRLVSVDLEKAMSLAGA